MPFTADPCRHCRTGKVNRPRGLCWNCFYAPGVRDLYPSASKYATKTVEADHGAGYVAPLPEPTAAPPGSPEKIAEMERRAGAKQQLFHPDDNGQRERGREQWE